MPAGRPRKATLSKPLGAAPDALKKYEKAERKAAWSTIMSNRASLSPTEIAKIRGEIARNIVDYLPLIDEVIRGTREFSPTQARVFTALLNKVVPDLSASIHKFEVDERSMDKMSLAELEAIASGVALTSQNAAPPMDPDDLIEGVVLSSAQPETSTLFSED